VRDIDLAVQAGRVALRDPHWDELALSAGRIAGEGASPLGLRTGALPSVLGERARAAGRDEKAFAVLERSTRFSRYGGGGATIEPTPGPRRSCG